MRRESTAASAAASIGPGSWRFQRLLVMRWRSPRCTGPKTTPCAIADVSPSATALARRAAWSRSATGSWPAAITSSAPTAIANAVVGTTTSDRSGSGVPRRRSLARQSPPSEKRSAVRGMSKPALPSTANRLGPGNSGLVTGTAAWSEPPIIPEAASASPSTRRSVAPKRLRATPLATPPVLTFTVVALSLRESASEASRRRTLASATTAAGWTTELTGRALPRRRPTRRHSGPARGSGRRRSCTRPAAAPARRSRRPDPRRPACRCRAGR